MDNTKVDRDENDSLLKLFTFNWLDTFILAKIEKKEEN